MGGWGERETSYTREPGLGNTLTSAQRAHGRRTCLNSFFSYSSSSLPLSLSLFVSLSVTRLVGRVMENINRMLSCLIINPLSTAPWPPALDHVRSPLAPTPTQHPPSPFSLEDEAKSFYMCVCVMCAHVHQKWWHASYTAAQLWGWKCGCELVL